MSCRRLGNVNAPGEDQDAGGREQAEFFRAAAGSAAFPRPRRDGSMAVHLARSFAHERPLTRTRHEWARGARLPLWTFSRSTRSTPNRRNVGGWSYICSMTRALDLLPAEVDAVRSVWSGADAGSLSDSDLIAVNERYCRMRRMLDADQAQFAAEIARRSRPELGPEGLAKTQGYRNPTALIAATTGTIERGCGPAGEGRGGDRAAAAAVRREGAGAAPARRRGAGSRDAHGAGGGGDHRDARPGRVPRRAGAIGDGGEDPRRAGARADAWTS